MTEVFFSLINTAFLDFYTMVLSVQENKRWIDVI